VPLRALYTIPFRKPLLVLSAAVAALAALSNPASADGDYLVSIGDQLQVDILDDNDDPRQYGVSGEGMIQLPLIGGVVVVDQTLSEVRDLIHDTYVSREIFVDPTIEVSVAAYREIFVGGDVKSPGFYTFQQFITAEQAMGLAGGPIISANNEETRVLERRNLQGQLETNLSDLAAAAAELARFHAQIDGKTEIAWAMLPDNVRSLVEQERFNQLVPGENQIIALDQGNFEIQRGLLTESVNEAENELDILNEREAQQNDIIAAADEELKRVTEMVTKGLQARPAQVQAERQIASEKATLLQIRQQISLGERKLDDLKREMSRMMSDRSQKMLSELQLRQTTIEKLASMRESTVDRLELLKQWANRSPSSVSEARIDYQIRRRTRGDGNVLIDVEGSAELVPGDSLVVKILPPEESEELLQ
jgi:polysaccharide biosynthesis/export protein ExoF